MAVIVVDVHLHLAQVFVGEPAEFQINEHVSAEQAIVEDQIDEEMFAIKSESALAGLEEEPFAQFQEEMLNAVDDGGLEVGLRIAGSLFQPEKFQDHRFFKNILRPGHGLALASEAAHALLITAES